MMVLETRSEIKILVDKFYEKVNQDSLLAPVFAHVDWPHHLPIMYNFWASMLLGEQSYQGNPFQKHVPLPLKADHFDQWLKLFGETVDENFEGDRAQEVKERARSIARVFQHKLGLFPAD
ncbi:MAG TPA: group III truncated hemoglobin [Cyclobacteriaceae bacterium]|nr:group III truncated hemoglobin [Cyclobacteriaceae bacterium]HPW64467.1 group III truncated hemoglobin [Cyclobacteriaceae bacterium]